MSGVSLRPVEDADLDALFNQMRDPESVWMAAFTPADPDDRTAFDAHMAGVRRLPDAILRAVTCDGRLVGSIASFAIDGRTETSDNAGSLKVLHKSGFRTIGTETSFAAARNRNIEETILRLDT